MFTTLAAVLELVLPTSCVGCGVEGSLLCGRCMPGPGDLHELAGFSVPTFAAAQYDGAVREAVLAFKERGRHALAAALGTLLARSLGAADPAADPGRAAIVVPVPSDRAAMRRRGGNHVIRLARQACRPERRCLAAPLARARTGADATELTAADRWAERAGSMQAKPPTGPRECVIVDDVITTGATLEEAVRALKSAGWDVRGAAAVAWTLRRDRTAGPPA
jgi:predicted amidophosphoribosyltransferase